MVPAILLYHKDHALIAQSEDPVTYTPGMQVDEAYHKRNHAVNVHGSGLGWYSDHVPAAAHGGVSLPHGIYPTDLEIDERPCCYTGAIAPSHDRNLRRISESITTRLMFAHIRAAGPNAPVHEYNSHPFCAGRFMFMHNGGIAKMSSVRRNLEATLTAVAYSTIEGQTDSELAFAIFLTQIPGQDWSKVHTAKALREAMMRTLAVIENATGSLSDTDEQDPLQQ